MRRGLTRAALALLTIVVTGAAPAPQAPGADLTDTDPTSQADPATIPAGDTATNFFDQHPFAIGESLRYQLSWLAIGAGEMTLTATAPAPYRGRQAYTLDLSATSNDFFSRFFYVEDSMISRVEATRFESMRYEKHTREGKRVKDVVSIFDLDRRQTFHDGRRVPLPDHVLDTLSAVYYLRLLPLEKGARFTLDAHDAGTNYKLIVEVLDREQIKVPAGTFTAFKVEPKFTSGLFKKDGRMFLWITDDPGRILVQIRTQLSFGHITAALLRPDQVAGVGRLDDDALATLNGVD